MITPGDMQTGFRQAHAEFEQQPSESWASVHQARDDMLADIRALGHRVDLLGSDLGNRIDALHSTLTVMLSWVSLAIALFAFVAGVAYF